MSMPAFRAIAFGASLLGLAACGSVEQDTTTVLNQRLQERLGNDITTNRVALQRLSDGARVTFLDASSSPGSLPVSDPNEGSTRASMIEALLDPALMRVALTDTSNLPQDTKNQRVGDLTRYFQSMLLGAILHPEDVSVAQPAVRPGVAVDIHVICPHRHDGIGYDSGERKPDCF